MNLAEKRSALHALGLMLTWGGILGGFGVLSVNGDPTAVLLEGDNSVEFRGDHLARISYTGSTKGARDVPQV